MLGLIGRKRRERAEQTAHEEAVREVRSRLGHMWGVITGDTSSFATTDALVEYGWTAADLEWLERLGDHALASNTAIARDKSVVWADGRIPQRVMHRTLVFRAGFTAVYGEMPVQQARMWLAALCSEPEYERWDEAIRAACSRKDFGRMWHDAAGDLAPLAWLAGLTMRESAAQRAAGTLDRETLATLAVLRGVPVAGALLEVGRTTAGVER